MADQFSMLINLAMLLLCGLIAWVCTFIAVSKLDRRNRVFYKGTSGNVADSNTLRFNAAAGIIKVPSFSTPRNKLHCFFCFDVVSWTGKVFIYIVHSNFSPFF